MIVVTVTQPSERSRPDIIRTTIALAPDLLSLTHGHIVNFSSYSHIKRLQFKILLDQYKKKNTFLRFGSKYYTYIELKV